MHKIKQNGVVNLATIKEVAAAAGVSLGTASNVINGKTNNLELIEKVETAIRQLDYRPDAKARSLKSAHTYLIGVVVDSFNDYNSQQFLSSMERQFRSKGYSMVIRTSGNNAIIESKNIEYFIQLGVDGIIIHTSIKKTNWIKKLNVQNLPVLFVTKSNIMDNKKDFICISHKNAMQKFFRWCKSKQFRKTGFILEMGTVSIEELQQMAKKNHTEINFKMVGDNSAESGFKAAYELLYESPDIDNIVIGSTMLAGGVRKVLKEKKRNDMAMVCIAPENWIENDGVYDGIIELSDYDIGSIASNQMLEKMEQPEQLQTRHSIIYSVFKAKEEMGYTNYCTSNQADKTITIALLESDTTNVLKMLSEVYEKNTGIHIIFRFYSYFELWELINHPKELLKQDIDIVMYDILWKDNLIEENRLSDLTFLLRDKPEYFEDYINQITENFCMHEEKLYGLPFMTGTQLLLYQKDLFEDNLYKIQFRRKYGKDLKVPETWSEFNEIAEFFTKTYQEKSPISYGTALINEGNLYNSIDFFNRLWTYSDHTENRSDHYSAEDLERALCQYKESFQYSNQNAGLSTWEEVAHAFKQGDVAMVVLYDSFAFGINDAMISKVAGNVGSAMIPGGKPVLGGWGLGIPKMENEVKKEVLDYFMWSCGPKIAEPFSILSGTSSRKSFYSNKEASGLYPWKDQILMSYSSSRRRQSVHRNGKMMNNITVHDEIIGKSLGQYIRNELTIEEVIERLLQYCC